MSRRRSERSGLALLGQHLSDPLSNQPQSPALWPKLWRFSCVACEITPSRPLLSSPLLFSPAATTHVIPRCISETFSTTIFSLTFNLTSVVISLLRSEVSSDISRSQTIFQCQQPFRRSTGSERPGPE
jgi:hypothetical protein